MKKIVLGLALFSSLAIGISLKGQGKDNQSCRTFAECFSEILPNPGSGGGGSGSIPLPPSYEWKPVFTDAQFQIFCDANRVSSLPKYDPNYVTNNGGILCFESNSSTIVVPLTQKSPNFIIGGSSGIFDYYSGLVQIVSKRGSFIENIDGFNFYFIEDSSSKPLYLYDFRNDSYTNLFVNGFQNRYDSQVMIYCDANLSKKAKAVIQSPPKSQANYRYIYLAHKCNDVWNPFMIYINDSVYSAYNYAFIIRNHLPVHKRYSLYGPSELKAIPLSEIGKCIERNTKSCFLNSDSNNFKTILNFTTLDEFLEAKINGSFNLREVLPDINDGGFVVAHHGSGAYYIPHLHYPIPMYAVYSQWIPYGYFETDANLNITGGYLSVLVLSSSYSFVREQNNYCIYEYKDSRGFTHQLMFNKILIDNSCPPSVSLNQLGGYYGPALYILASNKGTILVIGSIGANGKTYTFLGILYPDTSHADGYYLTKIPFYPSSILKIYMVDISKGNVPLYGATKFSLIRVNGKDYFKLEASNVLLYSPQFNRSDSDAERY